MTDPRDFQPRLTVWGHTWRSLAMVSISVLAWASIFEWVAEHHPVLFFADFALGAAAYVLVFFRRRWPVPIAIATALLSTVSSIAAGPASLANVSVATRRQTREIVVIAIVLVATGSAYSVWTDPGTPESLWFTQLFNLLVTIGAIGWGLYIGSRRELLWTLRQRAETAEAERDLRAAQARSNERERIAREMHDVLAHRISQISLHAGALTYREDLSADEMRASVAVIQEKAHEALTDLRGVLGVLRDADGAPLTGPQPSYDDIALLVEDARAAGARIDFVPLTDGAEVPDGIGRTAYRIVQEAITNAGKHAPGAGLSIRLAGHPGADLEVTVRNRVGFGPTHTPGSGLGLIGLAERATLAGGRLEHAVESGHFVLRAWLPWAP